jgi:hypothetical protein
MLGQTAIVALLVIGCTAYSAWALMPAAARRAIAEMLLKLPLPQNTATALQKHLAPVGGCGGCGGCGSATKRPSRRALRRSGFSDSID